MSRTGPGSGEPLRLSWAAPADGPTRGTTACSETLIYELLDAHADTVELAADLCSDPRWAAHLDYLRALQRVGRATLAQRSRTGT